MVNNFFPRFFARPWLIVAAVALVTVFFLFQIPRSEFDNNNVRFIPADDPAIITNERISDIFGSSTFVLVALEKNDGDLFDASFLNLVKKYVDRIGEIRIVGNVNSIVTADFVTSSQDSIVVEKLVDDDFTGTPAEITQLKGRLLSWELYRNALISDDLTATQILVPLSIEDEEAGKPEVVDDYVKVEEIAHEMFDDVATVYVAGIPIISSTINSSMQTDLVVLIPIVLIVVTATLFFSFRRFSPVFLTLLNVAISTVWAMGLMPLFDVKLSILSTVLPVILVAVGSAYSIHVITFYIDGVAGRIENGMTKEEHNEAIYTILARIMKPVFLAALTTFAGFISFCFTSVLPIREWGIFASFGVIVSFLIAVTLIPALIIIRGPKPMHAKAGAKASQDGETGAALVARLCMSVVGKKRFILFLTAVAVIVSVYGTSKVIIDNVFIEYFKDDTMIARSDRFVREKFGGSKIVNVVLSADDAETMLHPDTLAVMDGLKTFLTEKVPETGKFLGFTDMVKRINQVFNADASPEGLQGSVGGSPSDLVTGSPSDLVSGSPSDPVTSSPSDPLTEEEDSFGFGFDTEEELTANHADRANNVSDTENNDLSLTTRHSPLATHPLPLSPSLLNQAFVAGGGYKMSAADLVKEINKLTNYQGEAYYELPQDPAKYGQKTKEDLATVVSNYLTLLSGSITDYANDPLAPTAIKATVQLRTTGEIDTKRAISQMEKYLAARTPEGVESVIGGTALVESSLNSLVVNSQIISLVISLAIVFLIMAISNRSIVGGFIGVIPLAIAIIINFAVMGFAGIKLNIGTSLVASLSVGIGVDYTIHFIESYKTEYRLAGGKGNYLERAFKTAGLAIIINAVSVGLGFAVLMLSQFVILQQFGLLVLVTMFVSALVSLTVIPVLLTVLKPKFVAESAEENFTKAR